jgi:hypothetical protein
LDRTKTAEKAYGALVSYPDSRPSGESEYETKVQVPLNSGVKARDATSWYLHTGNVDACLHTSIL